MPDEPKTPVPFWWPTVEKVLLVLVTAIVSFLTSRYGFPPPAQVVEKLVPVPPAWLLEPDKPVVVTEEGKPRPATGWVRDPAVIARNLDPLVTEHFVNTPAGK